VKVKLTLVEVVGSLGPLRIVVSGGVVSTTKTQLAGVGSTFPTVSIPLTSKVCVPSDNPV
jgi:hypothetical protein